MTVSTLSQYNRGAIADLRKTGASYRKIASLVGCCKSTVGYELNRMQNYEPVRAQHDADTKRKHCGRHCILTEDLKRKIKDKLNKTWSPEEVAHKCLCCSTNSIYNWIYNGSIEFKISALPNKGRRYKKAHENRGHNPHILHQIEDRPKIIDKRILFGDWECDTVLSSRGESTFCLATFVERKTRHNWMIKIPDRTTKSMAYAMKMFMKHFRPTVNSITTDNGVEFRHNDRLEYKYHIPFYFCDPYTPSERGTNERMNRRIRWFFPKKTNFGKITNQQINKAIRLMNNRPLKVLHWKSANKAFYDEINKYNLCPN